MEKNKTHHVMFGFKYVILGGKQQTKIRILNRFLELFLYIHLSCIANTPCCSRVI